MPPATSETPIFTLRELQASREYLVCSIKARLWLTTLINNGFDYTAATAAAYNAKNPRVFSYAVRNGLKVRAVLNLYFGRSEQEVFLDVLQNTIRRAPAGSDRQVRAQALYARLKWGVSSSASEEPEAEAPAAPVQKAKIPAPSDPRIPDDALKVWVDAEGVAIGFRDADGKDVRL